MFFVCPGVIKRLPGWLSAFHIPSRTVIARAGWEGHGIPRRDVVIRMLIRIPKPSRPSRPRSMCTEIQFSVQPWHRDGHEMTHITSPRQACDLPFPPCFVIVLPKQGKNENKGIRGQVLKKRKEEKGSSDTLSGFFSFPCTFFFLGNHLSENK